MDAQHDVRLHAGNLVLGVPPPRVLPVPANASSAPPSSVFVFELQDHRAGLGVGVSLAGSRLAPPCSRYGDLQGSSYRWRHGRRYAMTVSFATSTTYCFPFFPR
jgi:hypothetical protein